MFPTICRCCGSEIKKLNPTNWNLCSRCALCDDDDTWLTDRPQEDRLHPLIQPHALTQTTIASNEFRVDNWIQPGTRCGSMTKV